MLKSLLYLIKLSIVPILTLILGRILGIIFGGIFLNTSVTWNFSSLLSILSPQVIAGQVVPLTTFADLFMFSCLAIGMSIVVIQSAFFHDIHMDVGFISKLADWNLMNLIKSSYDLYHWGFIWSIYLIFGVLVILVDTLSALIPTWIFIVTGLFTVFSIMSLVKDVYNEIETAKKVNNSIHERQADNN